MMPAIRNGWRQNTFII